ncbi:hypothetical protein [Actinoplanes xinjiangensis]|uniref:hypothetical protein n=1 Tax=Actinoplanes xinjiangensis TaxID=512350 RepID=UPI00342D9EA1
MSLQLTLEPAETDPILAPVSASYPIAVTVGCPLPEFFPQIVTACVALAARVPVLQEETKRPTVQVFCAAMAGDAATRLPATRPAATLAVTKDFEVRIWFPRRSVPVRADAERCDGMSLEGIEDV